MSFENLIPEALEHEIGTKLFALWFGGKVQFELHGSKLHVYSPTIFLCEWIRKNFSRSITSAVTAVTGRSLQTEYLVRSPESVTAFPSKSLSDPQDRRRANTEKVRPVAVNLPRQNKLEFPSENLSGIIDAGFIDESPVAETFGQTTSNSSSADQFSSEKISRTSGRSSKSANQSAINANRSAINRSAPGRSSVSPFDAKQTSVDQFSTDRFSNGSFSQSTTDAVKNQSVDDKNQSINDIGDIVPNGQVQNSLPESELPRSRKVRPGKRSSAQNRTTDQNANISTNAHFQDNHDDSVSRGKAASFENEMTSEFESQTNEFDAREIGQEKADSIKSTLKGSGSQGITSASEAAKNRERKKEISKEAPLPDLITRDGYNIAIIHSAPKPVPVSSRDFASYDSFVVGKSNRLARSAADFAVDNPGKISPIFICGSTSVGKTHLLEGVCSKLRAENPKKQALFLTAGEFTSLFVQSLKADAKYFQNKFRNLSVLAIDDIHFLQGRKATQLALLSLIDMLKAQGVQMFFSADVPLKEMKDMRSEIISRIESGLVCEIDAPERDTLLTIFRHMASERGLAIPEDVCRFVVSNFSTHARQLSGVLNRLHAAYLSTGLPFTLDTARDVLSDLLKGNRRAVSLQDIERVVIDLFGISLSSLRSKSRAKVTCFPRMMAMWLARKYTNAALSEIGLYFGNRSHSTVLSAQKRVDSWLNDNLPFELQNKTWYIADTISRLENALTR